MSNNGGGGSNNRPAESTMDKLSNKLRLVRSQSMGVGMASTGGDKSSSRRGITAPSHVAEGRNAAIVLLDERRLEMLIQPRLYAGELLDLVASHCQLKEKEYFGLAVVDESGHYTWLQLDRKVLDHDLPRKPMHLTVHFLVKFFIESISHLSENKTIELFYLQARSLIFRGTLEVEADIVFQLAALSLQAATGDFAEEAMSRALIKKSPILPAHVLKEHPSLVHCEDKVIEHSRKMKGQTRGQAIVNYMTIVESMPTYGVHYFEVYDKRQTPWWLGLSCKGIAQYSYHDRKVPVRVFPWKQLENLYFRDKKFSIEVHDAKRVVQTLSSFNLYEDALKYDAASLSPSAASSNNKDKDDELVDAIADSTTQVSMSRRSYNPGSIHVYVWFGKTQGLTKCIWQSAISQHQFYLDRKQAKMRHQNHQRTLKEIARDLTRSTASLSSASSLSNLSRSGSTHSLLAISSAATGGAAAAAAAATTPMSNDDHSQQEQQQSEETKRARMEMVAALKARREALEAKLKEKTKLLKELCIKEGELTGELPPEIPLAPGEPVPQIRRRVGTEFALSAEVLLRKPHSPEEELLANLELEFEIQTKITSAALKLASDPGSSKFLRKQRKASYQQSQRKLREIENKLNALKYYGTKHKRKQPRPGSGGGGGAESNHSGDAIETFNFRPQQQQRRGGSAEDIRRGMSVPDLMVSSSHVNCESPISLEEDEVDCTMSPKSCPASPRKRPGVYHHQADSISLESSSPQRLPRMSSTAAAGGVGYVPSSVYLRSSYRAKQYPTLSSRPTYPSANAPLLATTAEMMTGSSASSEVSAAAMGRSATLPGGSPFRNKFESSFTKCDSPVGLYNCPQQRTSQAFSSLDDIDALTASTISQHSGHSPHYHARPLPPKPGHQQQQQQHHFPVRLEAAAAKNAYPSLERSIRAKSKQQQQQPFSYALANRELPALPPSSSAKPLGELTRSMEDLNALEAAGIHGRAKMRYREVHVNGGDTTSSLAEAIMTKLGMNSHPHHLRNTEEYPAHHHSPGSTTSHNMLGIRPLETGGPYPTPHASGGTLLPGQTYPEPLQQNPKPMPAIASLQDVFYHHHQRTASSVIISKPLLSSNSTTSTSSIPTAASAAKPEKAEPLQSDSTPPPLFPKQYHQVMEQRRRSGFDLASMTTVPVPPRAIVSESPAVNRRVKPIMATPPAPPPLPPTSSSQAKLNESFENVPSDGKGGKFVAYRESTKPFEMSDFYKYSTKYRKASSASSIKSVEGMGTVGNSDESNTDSPRSSTASGSSSAADGGNGLPVKLAKGKDDDASAGDLGDDFSSEMLAWYNSTAQRKAGIGGQTTGPSSSSSSSQQQPGKPATLV